MGINKKLKTLAQRSLNGLKKQSKKQLLVLIVLCRFLVAKSVIAIQNDENRPSNQTSQSFNPTSKPSQSSNQTAQSSIENREKAVQATLAKIRSVEQEIQKLEEQAIQKIDQIITLKEKNFTTLTQLLNLRKT